jgi:hypothetical protein
MLHDFQLAAIVRQGTRNRLLRIPMHQALQNSLAISWQSQVDAFAGDNSNELDFQVGYLPEANECFCLRDFDLPDWLATENSQTAPDLDAISNNEGLVDAIRGIVAFARNDQDEELMLFQNFSRSHVIRPGRFLFLQNNTYETTERPGLTLDDKLSALYFAAEGKLVFHSFRTVNTFLPLDGFYEEASEQQIREVLAHDLLAPEDVNALATGASQWFRKRFAMLRESRVLDRFSAAQIVDRSTGYEVNIHVVQGKIVFPADKASAKKLLQFLNEEIFRGAITQTLYETNSRREAD